MLLICALLMSDPLLSALCSRSFPGLIFLKRKSRQFHNKERKLIQVLLKFLLCVYYSMIKCSFPFFRALQYFYASICDCWLQQLRRDHIYNTIIQYHCRTRTYCTCTLVAWFQDVPTVVPRLRLFTLNILRKRRMIIQYFLTLDSWHHTGRFIYFTLN